MTYSIEKCKYLTIEEEDEIKKEFDDLYQKIIRREISFLDIPRKKFNDFCIYICKGINKLENGEEILFLALATYLYKYRPKEEQNLISVMKLLRASEINRSKTEVKSPLDRIFDEVVTHDSASMAFKYYCDFKAISLKRQEEITSNLISVFYFVEMIETKEDIIKKIESKIDNKIKEINEIEFKNIKNKSELEIYKKELSELEKEITINFESENKIDISSAIQPRNI